jgi:UDP-2,3-diacylglucosamine pyrophosphatase LpxH
MSSAVYDTLILSDLHLGSEISRAEQATRMLRENRFRRLILLGDIFSDLNFWPPDQAALEVPQLHPQTLEPQARD